MGTNRNISGITKKFKMLLIGLTCISCLSAQEIDVSNEDESRKRWFDLVKRIELENKNEGNYFASTFHLPKARSEHALFIDINGDGVLEVASCLPWDFTNGGRYYSWFAYQRQKPLAPEGVEDYSGWNILKGEGLFSNVNFLLSQLYEIKKGEKSRYFIFDDNYQQRFTRAEAIEKYIEEDHANYEGDPKGLDGSLGWVEPTREKLVEEFGEKDVLLWKKAGKTVPPEVHKENVTAEYLLRNWEKHTVTELYINEENKQVKGRLVQSIDNFRILLKGGEWKNADVVVEKYQWAYAKKVEIIGKYYDVEKKQPVVLDVGVEGQLIKVLEFGPHRETKVFTKGGVVTLKKFMAENKP